jgi:hypothetical protein
MPNSTWLFVNTHHLHSYGYWSGPYNILVPDIIDHVVGADGYNWLYQNGDVTQHFVVGYYDMNESTYLKKYGQLIDGKYYYKNPPIIKTKSEKMKNKLYNIINIFKFRINHVSICN